MNENEIKTIEEVVPSTEEITTATSENGVGVGVGMAIGAAIVLVGAAAYKYIAKPLVAKIKAKKEQKVTGDIEVEPKIVENVD